jgi:hypothetical protein
VGDTRRQRNGHAVRCSRGQNGPLPIEQRDSIPAVVHGPNRVSEDTESGCALELAGAASAPPDTAQDYPFWAVDPDFRHQPFKNVDVAVVIDIYSQDPREPDVRVIEVTDSPALLGHEKGEGFQVDVTCATWTIAR